jgi:hypothetical protein
VPPLPSPPVASVEAPTPSAPRKSGRKRGSRGAHKRWNGGKPARRAREGTRLQRQRTMSLPDMLADLPQACNLGGKRDSNWNNQYWRGWRSSSMKSGTPPSGDVAGRAVLRAGSVMRSFGQVSPTFGAVRVRRPARAHFRSTNLPSPRKIDKIKTRVIDFAQKVQLYSAVENAQRRIRLPRKVGPPGGKSPVVIPETRKHPTHSR